MVPFNNPMSRRLMLKRHAGSQMNSPRERTAVGKQWIPSSVSDAQVGVIMIALQRLQNELGKLRRRVVGGGASTVSGVMNFRGEWNSSTNYKSQNVVIFTPEGQSAGTYIALVDVSAGISPDTGSPNWIALPVPVPGQFGA